MKPRKGHVFYFKKEKTPSVVVACLKEGGYVCESLQTGDLFLCAPAYMDIRRWYNFEVVSAYKKYAGQLSITDIARKIGVSRVTFHRALKAADREIK